MQRWLTNTFFWKRAFDAAFKYGLISFPRVPETLLNEKRFHWRQKLGQQMHLSPEEAAFRAFEDFADDFFRAGRRLNYQEEEVLQKIAYGLLRAAPSVDSSGKWRDGESFLTDRWLSYLEAYHESSNG